MSLSRVIIISGASYGIGAAAARLFGEAGWRVVLAARSLDKLDEVESQIRSSGGTALAVRTDVSSLEDIQQLVRSTLAAYGSIDVLFNNAGIGRLDWLEKLDPQDDVRRLLEINLMGMIWMAQAVLPQMISQRSGHIINMISASGLVASPMYSIYAASKFGMRGFTEALRRETGIFGIHVSGIYPGGVDTGFAEQAVARRKTGIRTPRWLRLNEEDVARCVLRLADHPRRMVVIPGILWSTYWLNNLFPGLVDLAVEKFFVRRERE